jgi:hypothetical protein
MAPTNARANAAFYSGCPAAPLVAFCLRLPSFEHKLIEPDFSRPARFVPPEELGVERLFFIF